MRLYPTIPLWSQVDFISDKAPAREFRVSLEDIESGSGHLISGELANYEAEGIPFEPNDILFGKLRPYLAKFYQPKYPGTAGGDIHVYRPLSNSAPRFLFYVISSSAFIEYANISTTGVKMPRTDWITLRNFPTPNPPLDIQCAIAAYLDRETSEIDTMLEKLDEMNQLLENRKKSEVRESVAPKNGNFTQIKYLAQVSLGKTVQNKKLSKEDQLTHYVRAANIQSHGLVLDDQKMYMTPDELVKYSITSNDVLVVEGGAGFGRSVTIESPMIGWGFQNHVIRLRPNKDISGKFLDYTVKNHLWGGLLDILSDGATIPAISSETVRELSTLAISPKQQHEIAAKLDETNANIDAMIAKTRELKKILTERRSALITAAVTGQIEVH